MARAERSQRWSDSAEREKVVRRSNAIRAETEGFSCHIFSCICNHMYRQDINIAYSVYPLILEALPVDSLPHQG